MREFAQMSILDVWYTTIDVEEALAGYKDQLKAKRYRKSEALLSKARTRDTTQALTKLTTQVDGRPRIVSQPPLVVPVEELVPTMEADALYGELRVLLDGYARTLQPNRRHLLRQFQVVHMARKVVGVGSVGTRAWIILLQAEDGEDSLFLQAKEAQESVLAPYAGRSRLRNQGQRVVSGQQLMQAVSDIFLGWQRTPGIDGAPRDFYIRQLRDWKLSAPIDRMVPAGMQAYGALCARTLARAHARTGDRIAIAAYLGSSQKFDRALVEFAESYADVTEKDHAALKKAGATGRVQVAGG
jgi:hypothetical protein